MEANDPLWRPQREVPPHLMALKQTYIVPAAQTPIYILILEA